jgi:hypothetical protein
MGVFVKYMNNKFFVDLLSEHSHDHNFTYFAWNKLVEILEKEKNFKFQTEIKKMIVWSDGGLKTKENLFLFHNLSQNLKIKIFVNFFAPHHGHSEVEIA